MSHAAGTAVTLRALDGEPLRDAALRDMVVSCAEAIAERQGVTIHGIETADDRITVALDGNRIVALGFAAELRRLTTRWYTNKYGVDSLWGAPPGGDDDEYLEPWMRG